MKTSSSFSSAGLFKAEVAEVLGCSVLPLLPQLLPPAVPSGLVYSLVGSAVFAELTVPVEELCIQESNTSIYQGITVYTGQLAPPFIAERMQSGGYAHLQGLCEGVQPVGVQPAPMWRG